MRALCLLLLAAATLGPAQSAPAQAPPSVPEAPPAAAPARPLENRALAVPLLEAYAAIARTAAPDATAYLADAIASGALSREQWHQLFTEYYRVYPVSEAESAFWTSLLARPDIFHLTLPVASAAAAEAIAAVGMAAESGGPAGASVATLTAWLPFLFDNLQPDARAVLLESVDAALRTRPLPLDSVLARATTPEAAALVRLTALLAQWDSARVARWVRLPDGATKLVDCCGLLTLDGGAFDAEHVEALRSLFSGLPPGLHGLRVIVGSSLAVEAASLPGVAQIEVLPLSSLLDGNAVAEGLKTAYPFFIGRAAEQILRHAQDLQFAQRPQLRHRLERLYGTGGPFLTPAPPAPADLLPYAFYAWLGDSQQAWDLARAAMDEGNPIPIESLLLLADLLSGGEGSAPACTTSVAGKVETSPCALRRAEVAPGLAYAAGLSIGGVDWSAVLDANGRVTALNRE